MDAVVCAVPPERNCGVHGLARTNLNFEVGCAVSGHGFSRATHGVHSVGFSHCLRVRAKAQSGYFGFGTAEAVPCYKAFYPMAFRRGNARSPRLTSESKDELPATP